MGALPTKKLTRARGGRRMIRFRLKAVHPSHCPQCRGAKLPHKACPHCGYYKGRQIVRKGGDLAEGQ